MSAFRTLPLIAATAVLLASTLIAQAPENTDGYHLRFFGSFSPTTGVDTGPGTVSVYSGGFDLGMLGRVGDDGRFGLSFSTSVEANDQDRLTLPRTRTAALDTVVFFDLRGHYETPLDYDTDLVLIGGAMSGSVQNTNLGDTWTFSGAAGPRWRLGSGLKLGLAVGVATRLDRSAILYPVPLVDWKIDERWSLYTYYEDSSGLRLRYQRDARMAFHGGLAWNQRQYRLDDSPSSFLPKGSVLEQRWRTYVGAEWHPEDDLYITVDTGLLLQRQFDAYQPSTGNDLPDLVSNPAPFVALAAEFRF